MAKATPQQKKVYDTIVTQAMKLIYTPEQAKQIETLAGQGNPADVAASVAAIILKQIQEAAKSADRQLDLKYIGPAGKEIIGHIIEMMDAFKIITKDQIRQVYDEAQQQFAETIGSGQQQPAQPQQPPQQTAGLLAQGA